MADGSVVIDTKIDTSGVEKGMEDIKNSLKRMSNSVDGLGKNAKSSIEKQVSSLSKMNTQLGKQVDKVNLLQKKLEDISSKKVETEEYKNKLNEATAAAAIKEFNVPLDFKEATEKVKESYATYRDGLEIFSREYGIPHKDLYVSYHNYKSELVKTIAPYEGLLENLKSLQCPQYVFSTSSKDICEKILKHIGLYDFFAGRFYSVEDFDVYKKNESPDVYARLCQTIGVNPQECIFVDDSYSNLDFAKQCGMTTIRIYYGNNSAKDMPFIDSAYKGIEECIAGLKKDYGC